MKGPHFGTAPGSNTSFNAESSLSNSQLSKRLNDVRHVCVSFLRRIVHSVQIVIFFLCAFTMAPSYLAGEFLQSVDLTTRTRLRSASSLFIRRARLSTVGDRAFPVAAARVWNSLPRHVTSVPSLSVYCSRLKSHLFKQSFP